MSKKEKLKNNFSVDDFKNLIDVLHTYAFNANLYSYALEQLEDDKYKHMLNRFSCYHITTRNALIEAMLINLIRIYDRSTQDGINLTDLLDMAYDTCNQKHKHYGVIKEYKLHVEKDSEQCLPEFDIKYKYIIDSFDRLSKTLRNKIECEEKKIEIAKLVFNDDEIELFDKPLEIELTATEIINHLSMLIKSQNKKISALNEQRNKLLVHTDPEYLDEKKRSDFTKKNKLFIKDIQNLSKISIKAIICIDALLNRDNIPEEQKVYKPVKYYNQDDIVYVLNLLKKASDAEEVEMNKIKI